MMRAVIASAVILAALLISANALAAESDNPSRFKIVTSSPVAEIVVDQLSSTDSKGKKFVGSGRMILDDDYDGSEIEMGIKAKRKEKTKKKTGMTTLSWQFTMKSGKYVVPKAKVKLKLTSVDGGDWQCSGNLTVGLKPKKYKLKLYTQDIEVGGLEKRWTYMVYLGADNNLSISGVFDLIEMEMVGSDDNINIVVQAEFSHRWDEYGYLQYIGYQGDTLRLLVEKDNDPEGMNLAAGQSIGNVDMGSPGTLTDFIEWATEDYPAQHYALIMWDHGGGWRDSESAPRRGAISDETSGSFMSLPDLGQGVRDAGEFLDVINFDCCLMGMYEVAYEFNGLCDYFVASEETEPGDGDPYDTILAALQADPNMTPEQLSATIVEKYLDYYSGGRENVTKVALDMSRMDDLHSKVIALSDAMTSEWNVVSSAVQVAQGSSQSYAYPANHDLYDFCQDLAGNLAGNPQTKAAANAVMQAVTDCVSANASYGDEVDASTGIAIYAPTRNQVSSDQVVDELREYGELACNSDRAGAWITAVEQMVRAQAEDVLVPGGFGIAIIWGTDADLDLWVWEPNGSENWWQDFYAPWMGQASPNGTFSGDSYDTGESVEYYLANAYVRPGAYDFLAEYYGDGPTDTFADVYLYFVWPGEGITEWTQLGEPTHMDLSNYLGHLDALGSLNNISEVNQYSDWTWFGWLDPTPTGEEGRILQWEVSGKTFRFHIRPRPPKNKPSVKKGPAEQ